MIDIHCHVLPGVDDGPRSWEQSVELCASMAADGIRTAIATPHLIDGVYNNIVSRVRPLVDELNQRIQSAGIQLEVLAGAEVDIASRHVTMPSEDLPRLAGGKAVLLEMPVAVVPHAMAEIIFAVRSRDNLPVLAHPERNEWVQENLSLASDWVAAGAALQIDGDSLLGVWGSATKRCAEELLSRGLCHALASDAHSCERRPPRLAKALVRATALLGDGADALVTTCPARLLEGEVPKSPVRPTERSHDSSLPRSGPQAGRGFFARFRRGSHG